MLIFLTGGTGFVGAFLGAELLKEGHSVIFLARPKGNLSARKRVRAILNFVAPELFGSSEPLYEVVEGDITLKNLGLSHKDMRFLPGNEPRVIFHCAATVEFSESKAESTSRINVEGTRNLLDWAAEFRVKRFYHVSTLYVAGDRKGAILEEELFKGQSFNNAYERSKAEAEGLVRQWHERTGLPFGIFRLPIVLGESRTGKALSFTGFYGFFKPLWRLARDIRQLATHDPSLGEAGIRVGGEGISAPLSIRLGGRSLIDAVPVDWLVRMMVRIARKEAGGTFHLNHPTPPSSLDLVAAALPVLGFKEIEIAINGNHPGKRHPHPLIQGYQRMLDAVTNQYSAYASGDKRFDNTRVVDTLGNSYQPPPAIDKSMVRLMLSYAMEKRFRAPEFIA